MRNQEVQVLVQSRCIIGEGPVYGDGLIYWIDLLDDCIYRYDFASSEMRKLPVGQNTGCIALRASGGLIAALQHGFHAIDFETGRIDFIGDPEADKPNNRFNDGKCDPAGRFWAGTMSKNLDTGYGAYVAEGKLYCLDENLHVHVKDDEVILSNGIDWSPDAKTMYYIDTPKRNVVAWDYDVSDSSISRPREVISLNQESGMPDGMCVDAQGMLWIALWGGGCITRWDPCSGKLLQRVELPVRHVTSCVFGGEQYRDLFITTASLDTDMDQYPLAGSVFTFRPEVGGKPLNRFRG